MYFTGAEAYLKFDPKIDQFIISFFFVRKEKKTTQNESNVNYSLYTQSNANF